MSQLDTLNLNDLYQEIAELARAQGVADQAAWDGLCSEVINSHLDLGEMGPDQDTEAYLAQLRSMWPEYVRESGEESLDALGEDPTAPHA